MAKDTEKIPKQLPINQETLDIIVANVIPTSKYFEVRFDHLEQRVDQMQGNIKDFRADVDNRFNESRAEMNSRFNESKEEMNNRFEQADKRLDEFKNDVTQRFEEARKDVNQRFEQVDKRFEQVDKRFEQVDQRLEQIVVSIDRLTDKLDYRDHDQRSFTMRMFSISILISFLGVLGVFLKIFKVV